ncbi:MAG: T9SS type A sorting domain-containing protein [Flavobacteriaceae bacterium]|nr:T9SS type A sorting domain-containing protein [Mangrovimonas sp.]MCB0432503.1 T9SS type A sorting domain-containing protein [Mangrovimonas sp.]MCB0434886.1 T9SS type A sorting domain-containing protein [Mangrovimonas sp.]MCB0469773.1 T9SS type A sorting domain-containing protein [Flavobacteriaceae bacterium]
MKQTLLNYFLGIFSIACINAQTTFATKQTINASISSGPYVIESALIDNDAFIDIVVATELGNVVQWYKNNGDGTFTLQPLVSSSLPYVYGLKIADLNGDTFNDIIACSYTGNKIVWFANDGNGNFGSEQLVANLNSAVTIEIANVDNDGDLDVIGASYNTGQTNWYQNDGSGNFGSAQPIASVSGSSPGAINSADFDGDTDMDFVIANTGNGTVEVYINDLVPGGSVSFTKDPNSVSTGNTYLFYCLFADVDNDTNYDILVSDLGSASVSGSLTWYKKEIDGTYTGTPITTSIFNPADIEFKDLDDDSLNDIVLSSGKSGAGNDIVWFKNNDGGNYASEAVIDNTQSQAYNLTINDFDNDVDLDIASIAYNDNDLNSFENLKYTLSIDELTTSPVFIYPNPTTSKLNFKGFETAFNVDVYDILGKKVVSKQLQPSQSLDVSKLSNGIYVIKFPELNVSYKFIKN